MGTQGRLRRPGAEIPIVDRVDITALLSQIATDAEYNPYGLKDLGPAEIAEVRRALSVPSSREAALAVLAALGEPFDHGLVPAEIPRPMVCCESWYALRTTDQDAVLEAFGYSSPIPVTMLMGHLAWRYDGGRYGGCLDHERVYVSPALNGWTLVLGIPSADYHRKGVLPEGEEDPWRTKQMFADEAVHRALLLERCAEFSRRFGAAHHYFLNHGDSQTSWYIAENGEVVRAYEIERPEEQIGEPEAGYRLPHEPPPWSHDAFADIEHLSGTYDYAEKFFERYRQLTAVHDLPDTCDAYTIAGLRSVLPGEIGPDTEVVGRGVLARTTCGGSR